MNLQVCYSSILFLSLFLQAICTKTAPGQSSCTCSVGWTGDGKVCTPINYCVQGRCHENAKCTFLGPGQVTIRVFWLRINE